ncbi:MAG: hypothetical protein IJB73_01360 [Firmicutes bacterium]|nr:hypothetical protein [Bacillota bacterium]
MEKKDAVEVIIKCARLYKDNLAGKILLLVCKDKNGNEESVELHFDGSNFLHLTGCRAKDGLTAKSFYRKCLSKKLSINDFEMAEDGTTVLKLKVLPALMEKGLSAKMIGDYDGRQPRLYTDKLAGNIRGCMGFKEVIPGKYVPNTVLNVDIRKQAINVKKVTGIYIRNKGETEFKRIL